MDRQGISFTLTIVVTGVILLMTALSIITLGGSSITQFFQTVQGQQQEQVQEAEIREACDRKARQVRREYCSQYLRSSFTDDSPRSGKEDVESRGDYMNGTDAWSTTCTAATQAERVPKSRASTSSGAFVVSPSQRGCSWPTNTGISPTVTVRGSQFSCVNKGYISETCPVQ